MIALRTKHSKFPIMQSEELRASRKEMGLTQQEAADRYEISLAGYKQYELGRRPIPGPVRIVTRLLLRDYRKI